MERMNRGLRNGDVPVAALVLVACLVIQTGRTGATETGDRWLDWVAVTVPCLVLFGRNRWPVQAFAAVFVLVGVGGLLGVRTPGIFLVPLVALYAVARHRPARYAWVAVAVTVLAGFLAGPADPAGWTGFAAVTVITVAIAVIGINQRTRQAYLTALEDQARRLEVERDQRDRLAVAAEQARIAREMHDVVAHHLTVMVALSEGAAASVPAAPARAGNGDDAGGGDRPPGPDRDAADRRPDPPGSAGRAGPAAGPRRAGRSHPRDGSGRPRRADRAGAAGRAARHPRTGRKERVLGCRGPSGRSTASCRRR